MRGLANPPLDEIGVAEAERMAAALAPVAPVHVYSSPLDRAMHTARIVAAAAGAPQSADERFNDRDYGPWTGHLRSEVIAQWGSVDAAPGVEPVERVLERALPALDAVLNAAVEAMLIAAAGSVPDASGRVSVVVVTHDAVIGPLIRAIDPTQTHLTTPTASWNELVRTDGVWSVLSTDQVAPDAV
jgi:broad specificity phosphatase PhoE